jgi:hypothetical protein
MWNHWYMTASLKYDSFAKNITLTYRTWNLWTVDEEYEVYDSLCCHNSISASPYLPTSHFIALKHWGIRKDAPGRYRSEKCAGISCEIPSSLTRKLTCVTSILFKSWYIKSILILSSHQLLGRLWRASSPLKPGIVHSSTPLAGRTRWKATGTTRAHKGLSGCP